MSYGLCGKPIRDEKCINAASNEVAGRFRQMGGVTQLKWITDLLFVSGHRQDNYLRLWDLRMLEQGPIKRLRRSCRTNQRVYIDVMGDCVISGDDSGYLNWYDVSPFIYDGGVSVMTE